MYIHNPVRYFKKNVFFESLLISYIYRPQQDEFELVCDKAYSTRIDAREFVQWKCSCVDTYRRDSGLRKARLKPFIHQYNILDEVGSKVIMDVGANQLQEHRFHLEIWFGESFGRITFNFRELVEHKKFGVAKFDKTVGDYVYYDQDTSLKFEPAHPFK